MSASTATAVVSDNRPRSATSVALLHARFHFIESVRVPIVIIGNVVFPAIALLFFVVPNEEIAAVPVVATAAVAQIVLFAVMSTSLFSHGIGLAEDRAMPFDSYLRTLPAGAAARLAGRVLNGLLLAAISLVPVVLVGFFLTEASLAGWRFGAGLALVLLLAVPFALAGLAIGYAFSSKAAVAGGAARGVPAGVRGRAVPPAVPLPGMARRDLPGAALAGGTRPAGGGGERGRDAGHYDPGARRLDGGSGGDRGVGLPAGRGPTLPLTSGPALPLRRDSPGTLLLQV